MDSVIVKLLATISLVLALLPAPLAAQPRVNASRPLMLAVRAAELHESNGDWGAALAELEPAIDSAASGEPMADALYLQARANFAIRRYEPTRAASRRFLADYNTEDIYSSTIRYINGVAAYQTGDTAEALRSFRPILRYHAAKQWIARIHADHGRLDSAFHYASQVVHDPDEGTLTSGPLRVPNGLPNVAESVYLLGWIYEGRDQLDSAAAQYQAVLSSPASTPDLVLDARLRLGVIDARRGNYEGSLRLLTSLTPRSDRQQEEQTFYLAEVSSALSRDDEALRYYTEYVRDYPGSPRIRQARYGIGWSQLQTKRYPEAIATFRGLENGIDSIAAASAYQIGAIQITSGDTTGAIATFEKMLARLPYESFSDNAYYELGSAFYRRRSYDSARHYLLIAARQFPESELRPDSYYLLGESYSALGDATNAQNAFARSRSTGAASPLAERALYREGVMLYKVGRFASAIDRFRAYVSGYPKGTDFADATFWLGEALYQNRTYDEAERYYGVYLEKAGGSARWRDQALYGLAWSRFQQKDFKGAALAFGDFVKNNKGSALAVEATIRQADCYRLMGQFDKAIETYQSIGGVAGKGARDEEARFRLADVFLQMGEIDRAVETFRTLIKDYPNSPVRDAYAYNIGSIYHEKDMDSLAIRELRPFDSTYPNSALRPQVTFTIGDAYYNMEQFDSALVYYRRVLDEYPSSIIVPEALDAVRFTLNALGREGEAVAVIDSFQAKNPSRIPPDSLNYRKAMIVLESGNFADAAARFANLLSDFPNSTLAPDATFGIGRAHEYMGHRDSALLFYRQVLETYPTSSAAEKASIESAGLRLRQSEWSPAAAEYRHFTESFPASERIGEARYGLARAQLELKDTAAAVAQLKMVLDSGSTHRESDNDLFVDKSRIAYARVLGARGANDQAIDLLATVVARRMDDVAAEALLLRGNLLLASRDYSGALAELRRLTTDFNTFPEYAEPGMLSIGTAYEQLTNYAAARDTYTQLSASTQNAALKAEAEARLKKLKK
ncbi:MAG: tetratricopeptide repeat protein [Bacteroidetes bacterium]|nr:tetratricopeptide repeat protein [Bacteroidota bacterium]